MIITLTESGAPLVKQIGDQIRGLITTGLLAADQRLPSVRQLAGDLGVAPGTVAKAYRSLEAEGFLLTRIGSGTRVSAQACATPRDVLKAAIELAQAGKHAGVSLDDAVRVLHAVWNE
ncbi:GntR family transcriptional regulator [Arthrobacter psychrochitiniphilus]|uniref:GntR family transcriptional regulator n=1 Tax=Arthrobacter psychrochitiniphilus TaxID=291045 RepID=A0A2V3DNS3_9MICC|nr:GntR family transcriptional regulator [Arthrobacter psychrochitiniphilus]NYG17930.1 DNA-binding transcriptional regulator YhcF (GntR family) [Arthrobacter psychrochitiniphilus]PXA64129.1 GntR family transcriptional regulator [Arthrobacter psychrochitiniphilus]